MQYSISSIILAVATLAPTSLGALMNPLSACAWDEALKKAHDFVSQLTTAEKIGIATGGYSQPSVPCVGSIGAIPRLGFEGICFSDGPAGYSRSDGVSVFASGITAAATWDRELMYRRAVHIGEEFRGKGAHVHLGPSTGPMGRHARGGRNWEGFGPDPYLAGVAMSESVAGIQSVGVQACSKHYIGNEQETQRTMTKKDDGSVIEAVSSNIDDRTLHELYLWPFANAVKAGTATIMCAYNRVNGNYSCASPELMTILKEELAFPGYVVSDWYATHDTVSFANAGLDLEMPGPVVPDGESYFGDLLLESISNGTVPEDRLDDMAVRVMKPFFLLGQDEDFPSSDPSSAAVFMVYQYGHKSDMPNNFPMVPARNVRGDHAKHIRKVGAAGTVLLKNINSTLPLRNQKEFGVFGNDASYPTVGSVFLDYGDSPEGFEMGTLDVGGGSGTVRHTNLVTPLAAIQKQVDLVEGRVQVILENDILAEGLFKSIYPVPEVCILFLKAFASEGQERASIELEWNSTKAVESTAAICPNTVVVVHGPGVVLMPWADNENVTAILAAHYPGEETGNSIVDVLWGTVEPSGRLPYTIPKTESDYGPPIVNLTESPSDSEAWQADFSEGQMVDYKHFDANGIEPLYEFGFGLSYTEFDVGDELKLNITSGLTATVDESKGTAPGGLRDLWSSVATATVTVTNVGSLAGFAVPQLYVSLPQNETPKGTPVKSLRGFDKVHLEVGETRKIEFGLQRRDLSYWDVDAQGWVIPEGTFTFSVGFSSRDLKVETLSAVLG